jgi:hypothetical protein
MNALDPRRLVILLTDMFSGHNVVIFDLTFCSFIIVADDWHCNAHTTTEMNNFDVSESGKYIVLEKSH